MEPIHYGGQKDEVNATSATAFTAAATHDPSRNETYVSIMYFSRAKHVQLRRIVVLFCACLILLYFLFQEQVSEKLCYSLTGPLSIVSAKVSVIPPLEAYFCARNHDRAGIDVEWNLFYHLGGNGPWIPKVDGVVRDTLAPPAGCVVNQVHMV